MPQIEKKMSLEEAFQRLSARCAVAECAPYDLLRKMERWNLDEDSRQTVLQRLKKHGYVDEQRYASAYVRDKFNYAGWGKIKIMHGLRQKGISTSLAGNALDEIPDKDYRELLKQLLLSKSKGIKAKSQFERNGKLLRFAVSRGFEQWMVMECMDGLSRCAE